MTKTIIFLNGELGKKVLQNLLTVHDNQILALVINSPEKRKIDYEEELKQLTGNLDSSIPVFTFSEGLWGSGKFLDLFSQATHGVSILFGHMIPQGIIEKLEGRIINLHPSFLPYGRGADPIPWAIIENIDQGVSIHRVTAGLDEGPILAQKKLKVDLSMSAGKIYELAMNELFNLFQETYPEWLEGRIGEKVQSGPSTKHYSEDLIHLRSNPGDFIDSLESAVRVIQALTYSDGRYASLMNSEGKSWKISIKFEEVLENGDSNFTK